MLKGALETLVKRDIRDVLAPREILVKVVVVVKVAAAEAAAEQNGPHVKQLRGK